MSALTVLDLFSGGGGLSLGLKAVGFTPIAGVEIKADARATYAAHTPEAALHADIRDVDFTGYRGVDLVAGGPPCQPYSTGGRQRGRDDARDMLPEFLRAVAGARPRAVLMENVPGLASPRNREHLLHACLEPLRNLGYRVVARVLDAADHGVPQHRRRLFVVGFLGGCVPEMPPPTHGPGRARAHVSVAEALAGIPTGRANTSNVVYAKNPDLRPSPYDGLLFNGGGRPLRLDRPSRTILASAGGNKTHFIDTLGEVPAYHAHLRSSGPPRTGTLPGAARLTITQSAALQTFPPDLTFAGPPTSQYTQIGDAVPPRLAEAVGRAISTALTANKTAA